MPPNVPPAPPVDPALQERLAALLATLGEHLERIALDPYRGPGERSYLRGHWVARLVTRGAATMPYSMPRTCTAPSPDAARARLLAGLVQEVREKAAARRTEAERLRTRAAQAEELAAAMEAAVAREAAAQDGAA